MGAQIKLHIGCGKRELPGWVHIDGADFPHIQHHDITKLPFEDSSVDEIYSAHLIAYADWDYVQIILKEWYRVLKPGGELRIATPDFEVISELYRKGAHLLNFTGPLYGSMEMGDQKIFHRYVYDLELIRFVLGIMGFKYVRRYDYKDFLPAGYDDHSMAHYPHDEKAISTGEFTDKHTLISLNVVCQK